mmetsp:Transcript_25179/g.72571  ORF Transcript_25179/g.72571 Transcript_25179/m.72571 type:complete len:248 (+) Transcript_25179:1362-2105(+)
MLRDAVLHTPHQERQGGRGLDLNVRVRHKGHHAARSGVEYHPDHLHLLRRRHWRHVLFEPREQVAAEPHRTHDRENGDHQGQPIRGDEARRRGVPPRGDRGGQASGAARVHEPAPEVLLQRFAPLEQGERAHGDRNPREDHHQVGFLAGARLRRGRRADHRLEHGRLLVWGERHGARPAHRLRHRPRPHPELQRGDGGAPVQGHELRQPGRRDRPRCGRGALWRREQKQRRHIPACVEVPRGRRGLA